MIDRLLRRAAVGWVCLFLLGTSPLRAADSAPEFELKDGDRVVTLGGTFVEREGQFGYIETVFTTAFPDRMVTFRNLGWSGDTVWAESRGIFDPAQVGYGRMIALVKELKPTLIVFSYGQNESFAGDAGLEPFVRQFEKLCADVKPTGARLAFITPHKFEKPRAPLPDASRHNAMLGKYADAVRQLAARREAPVLDLYALDLPSQSLTENGLHFGPNGYAAVAQAVRSHLKLTNGGKTSQQEEAIRQKIVEKNMLFFHRWRPQNITYLTGFRKHEQGNNAVEIAQFDPLVEQIEIEINAMKKP
ncbi:MAG: SGNH/GDSL hydrolase family protein [Candidatus Saccharimonas sp.]|nr:SGNH/GDSL hydrolase family protein [Planctomycetaceae bacterium]